MLKSIDIKGLAVVNTLNLELTQGLTVLTGETGAGKSILLTAMKLCLGERADTGLLRPGVERADITLDFDIKNTKLVKHWLQQHDLNDDDECLIRRTINSDGRSRAFINSQAVNLKTLQSLSTHLVSIHGQHAHLDLLQPQKQCQLLDDSCQPDSKLGQCRQAYDLWKSLIDEQSQLTDGHQDNDSEKKLLQYQIEELEQANIAELDYDELVQEHTRLSSMTRIIELGESQASLLYENDVSSIHTQLSEICQQTQTLSELAPAFSPINRQLNESLIQIHEASRDLRSTLDQQETDPEQLDKTDQQLSNIHQLARKLQVEPYQLQATFIDIQARLHKLETLDERLVTLKAELITTEKKYQKIAQQLHQQRLDKAKDLSKDITTTLKTLGLPDGQFSINVDYDSQAKPSPQGLDQVQFNVTTNPGMPVMPISKVASGGELSRISLAIQVVATQANTTPTLVFDEVDAGIGGGVAETVGKKLRELADQRQIICVTHLPQVAAQGQTHLFVNKEKDDNQTQTQVKSIDMKKRIYEIARMLGGVKISEKTLAHAKEMLGITT